MGYKDPNIQYTFIQTTTLLACAAHVIYLRQNLWIVVCNFRAFTSDRYLSL